MNLFMFMLQIGTGYWCKVRLGLFSWICIRAVCKFFKLYKKCHFKKVFFAEMFKLMPRSDFVQHF